MEDDQQFCLRWNNHQTTLIQNFDTLLESGTLVDCTLAAEGKYLKAHKVVLSACSPYFEGLLSEHYDKHPVFILKDVKFKELKAMMDYMYRGEVNISQDQLAALLKAAESLQIKGLSESKTGSSGSTSSSKAETRSQKTVQPSAPSLDIPHSSSGLTIEKNNKVPRQSLAQASVGDLPEDSASPSLSKGISSREGSVSPNGRKRKRYRRRSLNDDNPIDNHETSNSSDMSHQPMNVPALGVAPVADEKSMSDPSDSLGRSALMQQLTKPADDMLPMPVEKPEPNDTLIEPKSEYLDEAEDSVEDLTLDDEGMDDTMDDGNRAGPSHDPSHPGLGSWHVTGDRSNAGGVVGSVVAGAPGSNDEVFMQAQEAAQAHRDSQGVKIERMDVDEEKTVKEEKKDHPAVIIIEDDDNMIIESEMIMAFEEEKFKVKEEMRDGNFGLIVEQEERVEDLGKKVVKEKGKNLKKKVIKDKDKIRDSKGKILGKIADKGIIRFLEKNKVEKKEEMIVNKVKLSDKIADKRKDTMVEKNKEIQKEVPAKDKIIKNKVKFIGKIIDKGKVKIIEKLTDKEKDKVKKVEKKEIDDEDDDFCEEVEVDNEDDEDFVLDEEDLDDDEEEEEEEEEESGKPRCFSCPNPNCKRTFSNLMNMNEHVKIECSGPTRYKCSKCTFQSITMNPMVMHISVFHSGMKVKIIDRYNV
ncbi:uncharacterized protein LOC141536125 isoform X1 [Cotesia typhae]|uniref:uncharacterized protein LOC141536125 isoform X1 n=1 Tax=Cotesia typhae TaxID=2053667 RepID=UPI003D695297